MEEFEFEHLKKSIWIRHLVSYVPGIVFPTDPKEIARLNIWTLSQEGKEYVEGRAPTDRTMQFTLHKDTGLVYQLANKDGWVYQEPCEIRLLIGNEHGPVRITIMPNGNEPISEHVMDVICAMEDIVDPRSNSS